MIKLKLFVLIALMAVAPLFAKAGPAPKAPDESFFIHLHDQRAMANATISSIHDGAVEIAIQIETVEEMPLKAEAVTVTLGNPAKGVAFVTAPAKRTADSQWSVKMAAAEAGRWDLVLDIRLAPTETVHIASPILIY